MPLPKQEKKEKKIGNCGNGIAENGKKKKLNGIMAMSLPKMGGKKKILLPKSGKKFKKNVLHSQYFYNTFTTNHK